MESMPNCHENQTKWTGAAWELGWQMALKLINGLPPKLARCPQIEKSFTALDDAFVHGDSMRFQLALVVLTDSCAETVNREWLNMNY